MEFDVALFFRDQLREARAAVLRDSEGYEVVVLVLERLGRLLRGKPGNGLNSYKKPLQDIAAKSLLADAIPALAPDHHLSFERLFTLVCEGRNAAVHEGALARHLTAHALDIALVLEDALMVDAAIVSDYMVRDPVVALPWQPLSFIRQVMLMNSFSYLPVRISELGDGRWHVVSDVTLARFLRAAKDRPDREARMSMSLHEAVAKGHIKLQRPEVAEVNKPIGLLLEKLEALPVLVATGRMEELIGIVTAFDLL